MQPWEVKIDNIDDVRPLLDARGLNQAEIMVAIAYGETERTKLVRRSEEDHSLVRMRYGTINIYVEYIRRNATFSIVSAYSHRTSLASDESVFAPREVTGEDRGWLCHRCRTEALLVQDIALVHKKTKVGALPGYRCGTCGLELLSEAIVVDELLPAEDLLFAK
jgi:hypothetical protein